MRLIVAVGIAATFAALALAAMPAHPFAGVIARVRVARGESRGGWRARIESLPLIRSWRPLDAETLRLAGLDELGTTDVAALKVAAALALALPLMVLLGPSPAVALAAYAAFVAPSVWIERRAASRIAERRDAVLGFVDRVAAQTRAGATVEQAVAATADAAGALAPLLRESVTRAALGVPLFDACAAFAERDRVDELRDLCRDLSRARRGGRPLLPALGERREVLRLARRAARLEAASRVDGALSLVLVLAYMPALLLLVVIPLFLGLLAALG